MNEPSFFRNRERGQGQVFELTLVEPIGHAVEDCPWLAITGDPLDRGEGGRGVPLVVDVVAVDEDDALARRRPQRHLDVGSRLRSLLNLVGGQKDQIVAPG